MKCRRSADGRGSSWKVRTRRKERTGNPSSSASASAKKRQVDESRQIRAKEARTEEECGTLRTNWEREIVQARGEKKVYIHISIEWHRVNRCSPKKVASNMSIGALS